MIWTYMLMPVSNTPIPKPIKFESIESYLKLWKYKSLQLVEI